MYSIYRCLIITIVDHSFFGLNLATIWEKFYKIIDTVIDMYGIISPYRMDQKDSISFSQLCHLCGPLPMAFREINFRLHTS
jgi:hypothetical protein